MKTARTAALIGMILGGALVTQAVPAYALPTVGCCQYSGPSSCVGGIVNGQCPGTGATFLPQYLCFQDNCVPPIPTPAKTYTAWFARAMDECSSATVTVLSGQNLPSGGCLQANGTTDSALLMTYARLSISSIPPSSGRLHLVGRGFQPGARVQVQLTVRVTKPGQDTPGGPMGGVPITFPDATVLCPESHPFFVANQFGALAGTMNLSDCLPNGLSNGNIEILDAALINVDNGLVFARPGIER